MDFALPKEFELRMRSQLGAEYEDYIESLSVTPPVSVRFNHHKISNIPVEDKVQWESQGCYLAQRPQFTLDPLLHSGAYYVQEASSMFVGYAFRQLYDNQPDIRVLDLCAAPGGKSTHLASLLGKNGLLVCNEVINSRVSILSENLSKWGSPNVVITNSDPSDFERFSGFFDVVAVDAPCSGEGLFRREPAAVAEWSVDNTRICAQRQQRIIADIWPAIKPGGYLIYSTCTFCPAEDEVNMAWIKNTFTADNVRFNLPKEWRISEIEKDGCVGYRFIQHKTRGEGFFCCVFQKNDGNAFNISKQKVKQQLQQASKQIVTELKAYISDDYDVDFFLKNDVVIAIPKEIVADCKMLIDRLKVVKLGVSVAKIFGNKIVPEHDLAMSWLFNKNQFQVFELSLQDALRYLHRDNIFIEGCKNGYILLTYNDLPLGFVKNIGNRWNNLYPQNWKIRMNVE